jgi:hypothetical protein
MNDFFEHISNMFSTSTRTNGKRRINRARSKGFRNANINVRKGKCTTDAIRDRSTNEVVGFNKKRSEFDTAGNFNSLYYIDDP